MQSADLTFRLPPSMQLPIPDTAPGAFQREELLSWQRDHDAETIRFLSLVVGNRNALDEIGASLDAVHRYDITPIDADTFYGYVEMDLQAADASLLGALERPGLIPVPPIVYTGRETVHATVLGDPDALAGLLEAVPERVDATVERVSEHQHRSASLAGRLTARQFDALEVAQEVGYYEVPRTGQLADVAAELECSESAASTLLRSAQQELVAAALRR